MKAFLLCLCLCLAALTLGARSALAQDDGGWLTYTSDAGYAFDYPAGALVTDSRDASLRFAIVYVQFPVTDTGEYQGATVMVLENPAGASPADYAAARHARAGAAPPAMSADIVGGRPAARLARDLPVGDGDALTVLAQGEGVLYRLNLYGGGIGGPIEPSPQALAMFERMVASFRLHPWGGLSSPPLTPGKLETGLESPLDGRAESPLDGRAESPLDGRAESPRYAAATSVFTYPMRSTAAVQYGVPAGAIVSGTHMEWLDYAIRNLDQWRIKCYGVDWSRMIHTGEDWYRLDGANTAGAPVYAVADGVVARHNPGISYPGNVVLVQHRLPGGQDVYSMYGHVANVRVAQGQTVTRGQPIATVLAQSYTGRAPSQHPSHDSHLHFEMRYFLDGSNIYVPGTNGYGYNYPSCTWLYPGRGYTYRIHPDAYPYTGTGYLDPSDFIAARGEPVTATPTLSPAVFLPLSSAPAALQASATPTVTCADLLANGDFEAPLPGRPWTGIANTSSAVHADPLTSATRARSGARSGRVGSPSVNGYWNELLQTVALPAGVVSATLTYWRYLDTQETSTARAYDVFLAGLETDAGLELAAPQRIDNTSAGRGVWVQEALSLPDAAAHAGRKVWVTFKGTTDATLPSSLYIDDAQLAACAPPGE